MTANTVRQVFPVARTLGPDAEELSLRALYEHRDATVRLGLVVSADGVLAGPDGSSRSLSGPADVRILRLLRSLADTLVVGAETARTEGYRDLAAPTLVVVTGSGDVPAGVTPASSWLAMPPESTTPPGWEQRVIRFDSASHLVDQVRAMGSGRVLCEGGGSIASWLVNAGQIDDFCITTSSVQGAPGAPPAPVIPATAHLVHRLEANGLAMERRVLA